MVHTSHHDSENLYHVKNINSYKKQIKLLPFFFLFHYLNTRMSSVYVVTGASRGIGLEFVRKIANRDDQPIVFACARNPSSSQGLQNIINSNSRVTAIKLDITDEHSIKVSLFAFLQKEFPRLIVIN